MDHYLLMSLNLRINVLRDFFLIILPLRLKLTPTPREKRTRSRTQASEPKSKRARLEAEISQQSNVASTAAGYIQICDVDPSGKYVQIKNMSDQVWHMLHLTTACQHLG